MHAIVEENLEIYLEGRLSAAVERELEAHLAACAACRQAVADARETSRWLKTLVAADAPEPSPGFYAKVRQGIEAAEGLSLWGLFLPAFRQVAFAGFMLLALLGTYYVSLRSTELGGTAAELMLDTNVEREAPAMLASDSHAVDNPREWCRQCWKDHKGPSPADPQHEDRERVMVALMTAPAGD